MDLQSKTKEDLKNALKEKKELEVSVLRLLQGAIVNREKEKRYKLSQKEPDLKEEELTEKSRLGEQELVEVISSEAKKRREAIVEFEKGNRADLVEKEKKELEILQKYLPEQLSEEEIRKLAKGAIEKTGAKEMRDMGKIMSELMPKFKGKADGALVSKIVKELLSS